MTLSLCYEHDALTSVRPSVRLVDCDQSGNRHRKGGKGRGRTPTAFWTNRTLYRPTVMRLRGRGLVDVLATCLCTASRPGSYPVIPNYPKSRLEPVEFTSNGSHVALSQRLLSFLFSIIVGLLYVCSIIKA